MCGLTFTYGDNDTTIDPYAICNSFFSAEEQGLVMALPHRIGSEPKHLPVQPGLQEPRAYHCLLSIMVLPFEAKLNTKSTLTEKYWKTFLKSDRVSPQGK